VGSLHFSGKAKYLPNELSLPLSYAPLDWTRVAITGAQVEEHGFEVKTKRDHRYKDGRDHDAVETEALGQTEIMRLLTVALEERVSEPLAVVRGRDPRSSCIYLYPSAHIFGEPGGLFGCHRPLVGCSFIGRTSLSPFLGPALRFAPFLCRGLTTSASSSSDEETDPRFERC
jgi:hypothetical protein